MNKQSIIIPILLNCISSHTLADVPAKVIAYSCYSCHAEKSKPLPLSTEELSHTLLAFRSGNKKSTIMDRITKGFSETELKSVSTYLSLLN